MATKEEILLKVGLDGSGFDQGLAKSTEGLKRFSEHGAESFVHVERPARAFHHLLGEIGSRAPFVAESLEALVNPTTGAIALVGVGFGIAMEKMKDFTKRLDEVSAANAKAIDLNREGLSELTRQQKDFAKGLTIDPVTGITKAIGEEKDPATRLSEARQNRDRFARERNAQLEELKRVREQERGLTALPSKIKATEEIIESLKKVPYVRTDAVRGTLRAAAGIVEDPAGDFTRQQIATYEDRLAAMRAALGTPERLKSVSQRRQELEANIKARQTSISTLQDIIDPLAPNDALPRGKRIGTFNISGPGGTFSGTVDPNTHQTVYFLEKIANSQVIKDGILKVPNGP